MLLKIDCCGNVYYREIDIFSGRDGVNGPATFSTLKTYTGFDATSVKSCTWFILTSPVSLGHHIQLISLSVLVRVTLGKDASQ